MHILTQPPGYVRAAGNHISSSKASVYFSFILLPESGHMVILDAREADKVVSFLFLFFSFYSGRGKREERRKEFG